HVQPDTSQKRRLAVLPADQQDELPATPVTCLLVNKAEHGLEHGLLPQLQLHGLADPLTLGVSAKSLNELNRRRRPLQVKNPRIAWIAELADDLLILLAYPFGD